MIYIGWQKLTDLNPREHNYLTKTAKTATKIKNKTYYFMLNDLIAW